MLAKNSSRTTKDFIAECNASTPNGAFTGYGFAIALSAIVSVGLMALIITSMN